MHPPRGAARVITAARALSLFGPYISTVPAHFATRKRHNFSIPFQHDWSTEDIAEDDDDEEGRRLDERKRRITQAKLHSVHTARQEDTWHIYEGDTKRLFSRRLLDPHDVPLVFHLRRRVTQLPPPHDMVQFPRQRGRSRLSDAPSGSCCKVLDQTQGDGSKGHRF